MDNISLIIKALLNPDSIKDIKTEIANLQNLFDKSPIKIKLDVDNAEFKRFSDNLGKVSENINKSLNINVDTSKLDLYKKKVGVIKDETGKEVEVLKQTIKDYTTQAGIGARETKKFKQEVDELGNANTVLANTEREYTDKLKKRREEQEKLSKLKDAQPMQNWAKQLEIEAEIRKVESDRIKNQMQLNAQIDSQTQKLQIQLDLFKQKMIGGDGFKGELDIFSSKQKGKFDEDALAKIKTDIQALNINTPDLQNKIKSLGIQFSSLKQEASESGNIMLRAIENSFKFIRFYLLGGTIVGAVNALKNSISVVIDLDTSLTELNKVADLTNLQLNNITKRAYEVGSAIGRTGKEVIDATTEFKRAGFEIEEAFNLSKQALVLTNIGDGIDDVKEASSSLIAILRGFKKEASETGHIINALNEVSNNYAVDTNNLTEIMKRVSGTIAQTGTSYEQLLGLATGGFETLRNAEMVASGINMISQRLRGMSENGEEVTDLIPKIQQVFDKYTNGVVSVIDKQNGGLHSTYEILEQLSKVYPTLTDEAKAYINESIAGNRQNKVLVSIMENWQNVEGAIQSATNSFGSAERENEKYLNSISGKVSQFSSSVQQMWNNTISSDLIKFIVDLGTVIIKLVDNDLIRFIATLTLLSASFVGVRAGLTALSKSTFGTTIGVIALDIAEKGLIATTKALTATLLASPLFLAVAAIASIYLIIKAVNFFTITLEEQKQKVEDLSKEYNSLKSTLIDLQDELKKTRIRIDELNSKKSLTLVEQDEIEKLKLINKELQQKINLMNIEAKQKVEELGQEATRLYNQQFGKNVVSNASIEGREKYAEWSGKNSVLASDTSNISGMIAAYNLFLKMRKEATSTEDIERFNNKIKDIEKNLTTSSKDLIDIREKLRELPEPTEEQRQIIEEINNALKYTMSILTPEELFKDAWGKLKKSEQDYLITATKNGTITEEQIRKYQELDDVLEVNGFSFDKLKSYIDSTTTSSEEAGETLEKAFNLENALKDLDKLKSIIKELDDNDTLSYDSLQHIIDNYPQLLKYINDHKKLKQELTKLNKEEDEKIKQSYKKTILEKIDLDEAWYNEHIRGNKELISKIAKLSEVDLKQFSNLGKAKVAVNEGVIKKLAGDWAKYFDELGNLNSEFDKDFNVDDLTKADDEGKVPTRNIRAKIKPVLDIQSKIKKGLAESQAEFDKLLGDIDLSKVGLDKDKDKKSTSNQYDTKYVKEYNAEVEKLTNKLNQLNNEYKALLESGADYATLHKKLTEIIDTETKKQEALHTATEKMRQKQAQLQSQAKGYGVNVNGTQDEIASQVNSIKDADKRKIVLDIIKDYNDLSKAIISNQNDWWQSQFKKNETLKQDAQNYLNSLTKENDLKKSSIDLELKLSEARKKNYEVGSEKYIDEIGIQIQLNKQKQQLLHLEAEALRKILATQKEGSAEYLQTQKQILSLQGNWVDLQNTNEGLELDKKFSAANKVIADSSKAIQKLDDDMSLLDDNDIAGKMDIIGKKIIVKSDEIRNLKNEIDRLLQLPVAQRTADYNKQLEELNDKLRKATISLKEYNDQVYDLREKQLNDFENTVKEIEDKIVTAKRKNYEEDKKNYLEALKTKYNIAKETNKKIADDEDKRHKEQLERYDEDAKAFDELINAKINKIDEEQKAKEDSETVDKLNKEILNIQKQINALALDDTIVSKTKREELQNQLAEKQKELTKFQDKTLADSRKKNLKDELDKNKKSVEDLKKAENEKYEASKKRIQDELDIIEHGYEKEVKLTEEKYEELLSNENLYMEAKKMLQDKVWEEINRLLSDHSVKFESAAGVLGESIQKNLIDKLNSVKSLWNEILGYSPSGTNVGQGLANAKDKNEQDREKNKNNHRPPEKQFQNMSDEDWFTFIASKRNLENAKTIQEINDANRDLNTIASRNGINYDLNNKYSYKELISFKTGGYTGDNEGLAWLDKKEIILKDIDTSNILKSVKIVRDISSFISNFKIPNINNSNSNSSTQNINMPITVNVPEGTKLNENKLADIVIKKVKKDLSITGFKPSF